MKKLLEYINKIQPDTKTLYAYQDGFFDALEVIKDYINREIDSNQVQAAVKVNFAEKIYDDLIYDLTDRNGLKQTYWDIDDDVRLEIKNAWVEIINNYLSKISA